MALDSSTPVDDRPADLPPSAGALRRIGYTEKAVELVVDAQDILYEIEDEIPKPASARKPPSPPPPPLILEKALALIDPELLVRYELKLKELEAMWDKRALVEANPQTITQAFLGDLFWNERALRAELLVAGFPPDFLEARKAAWAVKTINTARTEPSKDTLDMRLRRTTPDGRTAPSERVIDAAAIAELLRDEPLRLTLAALGRQMDQLDYVGPAISERPEESLPGFQLAQRDIVLREAETALETTLPASSLIRPHPLNLAEERYAPPATSGAWQESAEGLFAEEGVHYHFPEPFAARQSMWAAAGQPDAPPPVKLSVTPMLGEEKKPEAAEAVVQEEPRPNGAEPPVAQDASKQEVTAPEEIPPEAAPPPPLPRALRDRRITRPGM